MIVLVKKNCSLATYGVDKKVFVEPAESLEPSLTIYTYMSALGKEKEKDRAGGTTFIRSRLSSEKLTLFAHTLELIAAGKFAVIVRT